MFRIFSKKKKPAKGTLAADLRAARKSGLRTAILVTMLVSGVVPAICMFWKSGVEPISFVDQLKTMFAVTLHTYPLTLAVAIITISRRQKWFHMRIGSWCFAGAAIIFCASISNLISHSTGTGYIAPAQIMQEHRGSLWSMPAAAVNATGGFYNAYGFGTFFAAILIGSYAGATANRFLSHVPKSTPEATELAREIITARNRAA